MARSLQLAFENLRLTEENLGSEEKQCSNCGKTLSPISMQQEIECRIIDDINYDVYNCGEYYQRSEQGKEKGYWCRICFFKIGLGDKEEMRRTEARFREFLIKREKESKHPNQKPLQEQLEEMDKLKIVMDTDGYKELQEKEGLSLLTKSSVITQKGGRVIIDGSGVELEFQPNSFKDGNNSHTIQVTIIPQKLCSKPVNDCQAYSTVMVEIQPNKLTLEKPAKLKLPHCFQLTDAAKCKAQVFHSHHEKGEKPDWKDITESVSAVVTNSACEIELTSFCWLVALILGPAESRRIRLYTLAEPYNDNDEFVTVIVGYHSALPGENEIYQANRVNRLPGDYQSMDFAHRLRRDLCIAFDESYPNSWRLSTNMSREKVIPYEEVVRSNERHFPFTFRRHDDTAGPPELHFKVMQPPFLPWSRRNTYSLHIRIQNPRRCTEESFVVNDIVLHFLSNNITAEWRNIGRHLEIPNGVLSNISGLCAGFNEQSMQMLIQWKRREGRYANINKLRQALCDSGRSDLADRLINGHHEETFH